MLALAVLLALPADGARAAAAAGPDARETSRVVIVRPPGDAGVSRQALTLLVAELQAAGFEGVETDRNPALEVRADIEAISARLQPVATFAIGAVQAGTAVELWLEDRVTGKLVIRRVELGA